LTATLAFFVRIFSFSNIGFLRLKVH